MIYIYKGSYCKWKVCIDDLSSLICVVKRKLEISIKSFENLQLACENCTNKNK